MLAGQGGQPSVHDENRSICVMHESFGTAAENKLARARVAISSHHHETGSAICSRRCEHIWNFAANGTNGLRLSGSSMASELPREITHRIRGTLIAFHDTRKHDAFRLGENRCRGRDGPGRVSRFL